jgi:hypothetical protein
MAACNILIDACFPSVMTGKRPIIRTVGLEEVKKKDVIKPTRQKGAISRFKMYEKELHVKRDI